MPAEDRISGVSTTATAVTLPIKLLKNRKPAGGRETYQAVGRCKNWGLRTASPSQTRVPTMATTCLINNYNYARFICHALDSALGQTVPFDEIIVVDDGSRDGSVDLLTSKYAHLPTVQIISKKNQGQLSCFNEGFARSTGDILFFLDADDLYEPNYVEQAIAIYQRDPSFDFVISAHRQFGNRDSLQLKYAEDRDLGYSVILALWLREWIGGPTSCLSMRRRVLDQILPLPFAEAWRIRADDCLVFGASLAGARKYYLAQPLVRYRVHDQNQFFGRCSDKSAVYRRRLAVNALFEYLRRSLCYDLERLSDHHHREFCTISRPTFGQLMRYFRISIGTRASLIRRLVCMAEMTAHFLRTSMRPPRVVTRDASTSMDRDPAPPPRLFVPAESAVHTGVRRPRATMRNAA
jgi:glycosyltransferase involved in cell wall biosynthesis